MKPSRSQYAHGYRAGTGHLTRNDGLGLSTAEKVRAGSYIET